MKKSKGFSLIEMAVVLMIVSLLLGSLLVPISTQVKNTRYNATKAKLETIREALIGYYLANNRFPCPATPTTASASNENDEAFAAGEDASTGICSKHYGFLPSRVLGLDGYRNDDGLLVDSWNYPFLYAVYSTIQETPLPSGCDTSSVNYKWVFTQKDGLLPANNKHVGCTRGNLFVCPDTPCAAPSNAKTAAYVSVIVLSAGEKRQRKTPSAKESENLGSTVVSPNISGLTYSYSDDPYFVAAKHNSNDFDDLLIWISPYILYNRLVTAGVYP